jgi:hypothetical protein
LSGDLTIYQANKATLLTTCAATIQSLENVRLTASEVEIDIVTSTRSCVGTVAIALGPLYSKAADGTLDDTGLTNLWGAAVSGVTDPSTLEAAYGVPATAAAVRTHDGSYLLSM